MEDGIKDDSSQVLGGAMVVMGRLAAEVRGGDSRVYAGWPTVTVLYGLGEAAMDEPRVDMVSKNCDTVPRAG